ncbi:hypothetical protein D3C76_487730 [compost metagenome]
MRDFLNHAFPRLIIGITAHREFWMGEHSRVASGPLVGQVDVQECIAQRDRGNDVLMLGAIDRVRPDKAFQAGQALVQVWKGLAQADLEQFVEHRLQMWQLDQGPDHRIDIVLLVQVEDAFLILEHCTVDILRGNLRFAGRQHSGALLDGEKAQQFKLAGVMCQPLLQRVLQVVHARELDQAFVRCIERDFAIVGAAHGKGAGQWNIVLAGQAQEQAFDVHGTGCAYAS